MFKAFDKVWHSGLLRKLKSYGISHEIFRLFSSLYSNTRLPGVLDGKSSQEYQVNAVVTQGSILGLILFLLYIVSFDWFRLTGLITLVLLMWKWMGLFLRKNHLLRCWVCLSLLNLIGVLKLSLLLKMAQRKLEPWFVLWSYFLLRLLCFSIDLPYDYAWNTVVTSGLVPLVPSWNY